MKKVLLDTTTRLTWAIILFLTVIINIDSYGQKKISDIPSNKYALQNLAEGIQSENQGLRKSAIYLAGKHEFIETEDALIKQLRVESESNIRVLIGMALFRMNSEKGMKELQRLVSTDKCPRVRRMSYAIYNSYIDNKFRNHSKG